MTSRIVARVFLTIGFLAASVAYSSWTAERTILDPTATRGATHALLSTPAVRTTLAREIRTALQPALGSATHDPKLAVAINAAVADPKFVGAFEDAIASLHEGILSDGHGRVTLDTRAVTKAIHTAVVRFDPKAAAKIKRTGPVHVPIGSAQMPHIGDARQKVALAFDAALAIALVLVGGALLLTHDRKTFRRVGRRVAFLAIGPLVVFEVLPHLFHSSQSPPLAVSAAILGVYGHRVLLSAAMLVIAGLSTWIIAIALPHRRQAESPVAATSSPPPAPLPVREPDVRRPSREAPAPVPEGLYL